MKYVVLLLLLAACGKDATTPPPVVAQLAFVAGDEQVDTVGQTLPVQLGAALTNAENGDPLPARIVNWVVVDGGGQTFVAVSQTGSDGIARNQWTLGPLAGGQKLVARYIDPDTGEPVTIDTAFATAEPGLAVRLIFPGAIDTSIARSQLPRDHDVVLEFAYRDQFNNPTWACSAKVSPAAWTWQFVGAAPTMPLLTVVDTTIVNGDRRFALLNLHASAQDSTWTGTQVTVSTLGCAAAGDSVFLHYDHIR